MPCLGRAWQHGQNTRKRPSGSGNLQRNAGTARCGGRLRIGCRGLRRRLRRLGAGRNGQGQGHTGGSRCGLFGLEAGVLAGIPQEIQRTAKNQHDCHGQNQRNGRAHTATLWTFPALLPSANLQRHGKSRAKPNYISRPCSAHYGKRLPSANVALTALWQRQYCTQVANSNKQATFFKFKARKYLNTSPLTAYIKSVVRA